MKKYFIMAGLVIVLVAAAMLPPGEYQQFKYVNDYLVAMGEPQRKHYVSDPTAEMIRQGEDLIKLGRTKDAKGKMTRYVSKYYKCTSCHNVVKEVEDLTLENLPSARLTYAKNNNIPFLQASTFFGIVNKATWYNDDYVKKYGSLVDHARHNLEGSIQLCAQECSQGRKLEEWEVQSILSYMWSLQLKMEDLKLTDADRAILIGKASNQAKIELIKSKYSQKNGATFGHLPESKIEGYPLKGNLVDGQFLYENSCQHCHRVGGESDLVLDNDKTTFRWLKRNMTKHSQLSLYEIIKKGTYAEAGHSEYMPLFSEEKMSNQQVEDLRAYIEFKAN